jgi:hypothetical protein
MRISNDYGETFGPTLKLMENGTIDEGVRINENEPSST